MRKDYDCVVVGGGASGMTAAIMAARRGKKVCIIEHRPEPGKKILQTGNGKCNYANGDLSHEAYPESAKQFVKKAFGCFGYDATINFFKSIGIYPKIRNGYIYPYSETALSIRNALWDELKRLRVEIFTGTEINNKSFAAMKNSEKNNHMLYLHRLDKDEETGCPEEFEITCRSFVLAAGSKAAPKTGSDGSGYEIARKLGLTISKPYPALVKLTGNDRSNRMAAGVRHNCRISVYADDKKIAYEQGEVQFTEDGISGIPVFQISRYISLAIQSGSKVAARLDLLPDFDKNGLNEVMKSAERMRDRSITNFFGGILPGRLVNAVADKASISSGRKIGEIPASRLADFIDKTKNYEILITGTGSFDNAQICGGGVELDQIDPIDMSVKTKKWLHVVGEILDVDGPCGGYNLQWAWSSGALAGLGV